MSMNLGYFVGTMLFGVVLVLLVCVIATLVAWHRSMGTAVGDWTADTGGLGYAGAALVFAVLLTALAAMYFWSSINHVMLFWAAFILTRPLGAAAGVATPPGSPTRQIRCSSARIASRQGNTAGAIALRSSLCCGPGNCYAMKRSRRWLTRINPGAAFAGRVSRVIKKSGINAD
jgi:hypothetical protein